MKVISVVGTRPEAIKMAPVIKKLEQSSLFRSQVCITGQHRQMLDQVLQQFDISPDFDLDIMDENQDLFDITEKILLGLRTILIEAKPDRVLVQGDTTTCFAAALAAFYLKIPVAHIEAGLRSGNNSTPFPEEMNRTLVSHIADLHFAPTHLNKKNLIKEGIDESKIIVTGNTVIDSLFFMKKKISGGYKSPNETFLRSILSNQIPTILVTEHRRENLGAALNTILEAIKSLALLHRNWQFIYPVHMNPKVQESAEKILTGIQNIHLIPPLDYASFIYLMEHSTIIISDSGGLQEEASAIGKPLLITRDVTERPEAIQAGSAVLVGTSTKRIIKEVESIMNDKKKYDTMATIHNPYGGGDSAEKIINGLMEKWNESQL